MPTYWNTSFSKICLGMKIGQQINFIVINKQADSLYSLIADGRYRATSLGRDTWRSLIGSEASLQSGCNKEGFNAACTLAKHSQARIGIIGNNQNNCASCDSRIGFGTAGKPNKNQRQKMLIMVRNSSTHMDISSFSKRQTVFPKNTNLNCSHHYQCK